MVISAIQVVLRQIALFTMPNKPLDIVYAPLNNLFGHLRVRHLICRSLSHPAGIDHQLPTMFSDRLPVAPPLTATDTLHCVD